MEIFIQQRVGEVKVGWLYNVEHQHYTLVEQVSMERATRVVDESEVPEDVKKAIGILLEEGE